MRKILKLAGLLIVGLLQAQIGINRENVSNGSVSLQFGDTENKGLILPYVTDKSNITEKGTILYDVSDRKVKYLKDANSWFDLSVDTTGAADVSIQGADKTEQPGAKVCISSGAGGTDTTKGILVLADADKAMVLPKVASPHLNIIDPSAGMMVYDTVKKQLAVYNGKVWTFWQP
ncbi:hypothetical protein C1637_07185 [Chryseobacterium lactis]|uniref:Uncharacterized protein n=1 Tax=Chryseobacterium lactis TaxID=1241981 RepID=A0A3G6RJ55_CHRLC|nr:hypothetical protein [Chryseobacterium lactis]AZA84614.1 hypothetical protein EG342_23155 [Chryseobacterium lactis]AZB05002.1 hypothetical protein EG341_14035 [Chryseobacterium lactis]PNW14733.1 hypothetical protein C1637_07185 [Chryseobacterium lactis]